MLLQEDLTVSAHKVPSFSIITTHFSLGPSVLIIYAFLDLLGRGKPPLIKHALSTFKLKDPTSATVLSD